MAVLARSSITLVTSVDIDSVYWFYLLQASTAAAPAKPTTVPATKGNAPSGWTTAEPTTVDINKTLYRVELTYFTDGTGVYSSVNKVSSYEAAKVAYNKATDVQTNLDDTYNKLQSMGEQLVVNGSAFTGDNTNFTAWTFDGAVANGTKGSFTKPSNYAGTPMTDESFPIDITKRYRFEFDAKSKNKTARHYSFLNFYDVDGNTIYANQHMFIANTLTTLSQDLKNGDTVVHLADLTNWKTSTGSATHQRGLTFWNYKNSFGYQYPELTYSRNTWANLYTDANVNKTAKTITLSSPWTHGTFPAGTKVSQSNSGANYKYNPWSNSLVETEWTHYVGYYDGTDYSGNNVQTKFPPGAATAKVGFLWNYQSQSTTDQLWITNISVMEDVKTGISNAQATADSKKSMIKINTASRSFTTANWKTYGAVGHSENWTTGSSYPNPNIKVGDTAYLIGTVSDGAKGSATIIGTVTAVNGTNGTSSIAMTSQQLIFGGDSVDNINTLANTANNTANEAKSATDELQPELIVGTHGTTATATWTGTSTKLNSIVSGTTIRYKLSSAGASNVTLNLTLANGSTTGAKNVYYKYSGTRLSTQYPINSIIELVYDGTQWHVATPYTNDNTYDRVRFNGDVKANNASGYGAITAGNIIVGTSAGYHHLKLGKQFDINYPILYCGSNISSGNTNTNNYTVYPVTIATTQNITLTPYKAVYIKGTLAGSLFTPVSTTPLTQTEPESASDTNYYMRLGLAYSSTAMYLESEHPIYRWSAGAFRLFGSSADEIVRAWCKDTTVTTIGGMEINGAHIATKSIEADRLDVTDLNAFGATIGGFEIGSNSIHTAGSSSSDTAENAIWLCGYAKGKEDGFTRSINGTSRDGLVFAIGGSFGVDYDGWIYAAKATISGKITATSGEIGNWTIGAQQSSAPSSSAETKGSLYTGTFGSAGGIYLIPRGTTTSKTIGGGTATDWRFVIGSKFGVRNDGTLYANGANLTGSITAASLNTTDTLKDQAVNESAFSVYRWDHFVYMSASISFDGFDMYMQSWGKTSNDWRIRDGYRPPKNIWTPVVWGVNGGFKLAAMEIRSDGWINLYGYETYGGAVRNLKTAYRAGSGQYGVDGNNTLFFNVMWVTNQTAT